MGKNNKEDLQLANLKMYNLSKKNKLEISSHITKRYTDLWKEEVNDRKSLELFKKGREIIKEEPIHNNP